ncbi:MAG: TolC family protein [Betaproteobacteria bacterium]
MHRFFAALLPLLCALCCALYPALVQAQTSLPQLLTAVLATHPAVQAQRAQLQGAQAGVDSARWQYYPTPSVSVETAAASAADRLYQGDRLVSTLRLQQPLWSGGRLDAGAEKAQATLAATQATLEDTRLQLGLRVLQAYVDWWGAQAKAQALAKSLATHEQLRRQVLRRREEGASAQADLVQAVARLEAVSAEAAAVRAQGEVALARLAQLLGGTVDGATLAAGLASGLAGGVAATPALPPPLAAIPTGSAAALLAQAADINPAVRKAQAQERVQEAVVRERRADLRPEVYARLERQYGNYNLASGGPADRLFIGINSRFGAGLSTLSNLEAAQSQLAAAAAEVQVQRHTLGEQLAADQAQALSVAGRVAYVKAALAAGEDVSASYDRQFLAGRKSWLDVMNAARELAQTETQLAELQATELLLGWRLLAYTRGIDALLETKP